MKILTPVAVEVGILRINDQLSFKMNLQFIRLKDFSKFDISDKKDIQSRKGNQRIRRQQ